MVRLDFLNKKQYDAKNEHGTLCSGTIFHENFIMTAAHCCRNKYLVYVYFNDHSRSVEEINESRLKIMNSEERLSQSDKDIFGHFDNLKSATASDA